MEPLREIIDTESTANFAELAAVIIEEIESQLILQFDDVHDPEWRSTVGELAADAIIHRFVVRERTDETPLARWVPSPE